MNDLKSSSFNDGSEVAYDTMVEAGMESDFLDMMLRNIDVGVAILDQDLRYRMLSNAARKQLNIGPNDIKIGDPLSKMHEVMTQNGMLTPEILKQNKLSAERQMKNTAEGKDVTSRLVKMGNGTTHRFCRQALDNGYTISVSSDVTELVEMSNLLNSALTLGKAAFWIYDVKTKHYTLSDTLKAILPEGGEALIQKNSIFYMVHPDDRAAAKALLSGLSRKTPQAEIDMRTLVANKTYRWTRTSAQIQFDVHGKPHKIRAFVRDIQTEREHEAELERMRDEAVHASKAKSEFLANMSHEIRTPMNGILGMAELLAGSNIDDRQREYVNVITSSATALLAIINDILDFSKIEAGALALDPTPFDLKSSVNDVTSLLVSTAQDKGLELIINYPSDLPKHFIGDAGRIRQILTNLVGNAIKFTAEGYVQIDVRLDDNPNDADSPIVTLDVKDTGIGIEQDKLQAIFDKFTQADGSTTRVYGGTGLGLAITKRIAEMMGGRVEVTSELGVGSTFGVRVPLKRDHDAVEEAFDIAALQGRHALIVDDIDVNRMILSKQLANWGMTSECADHGVEAMEKLKANMVDPNTRNFDVILLDYLMPGVNGREFASMLTNQDRLPIPKMVMLSSCDQSISSEELAAISISSYLVKPVRERRLFDTLGRVLGHTRNAADEAAQTPIETTGLRLPTTPDQPVEPLAKPTPPKASPATAETRQSASLFDMSGFDRIAEDVTSADPVQPPINSLINLADTPHTASQATPQTQQEPAPHQIAPQQPAEAPTQPASTHAENARPTLEHVGAAALPEATDAVIAPTAKQEILVAEDFPLNRDVVRLMLVDTAFEPIFAENGKIASDMYLAEPDRFPLILMDVSMPIMDGYEATKVVREWEASTGADAVPIIALTGHALKNDRQDCLDAGMSHYLTKPVKQNQLLEVLERYSGRAVDGAATQAA